MATTPVTAPVDDIADLIAYLDASPSPWHAVRTSSQRLADAGFSQVDELAQWHPGLSGRPWRGFVVRGGALIAWHLPSGLAAQAPMRLVGAHTDSPCLRVKPRPDTGTAGWKQLGVEVYGGVLANSWLDRDLGVAGRLVFVDGTDALVDVAAPIARVPQLAIHLDRTVNENGLVLDRQQHLTPVWGVGRSSAGDFADWIAAQAGHTATPQWWELCLYDLQGAAVLGADRSLVASGRLDNLLSCWAATRALAAIAPDADSGHGSIIVLNDHEEVGSASSTGAAGPLLEHVLERLVTARGGSRDELLRALAGSSCISADNAHAVHPNYTDRHEPAHLPLVNAGPAIKINQNQRYATSADTASLFRSACERASVPWQVFVSRNNMPCGSTIGPITSTRLGIATVDVGVPQLSMHSARELCGTEDPSHLAAALSAYFD